MARQIEKKLNNAVEKHIEDLYNSSTRHLQVDMHQCALRCFENQSYNSGEAERCVERCNSKLMNFQSYLGHELEDFQNRLTRCNMSCQDKIKDKMGSDMSEASVQKYLPDLEACAMKCADTHIDMLPQYFNRIKDFAKKNQK